MKLMNRMKCKQTLALLLAALMLTAAACAATPEKPLDTDVQSDDTTAAPVESEAETEPYINTLPMENYDGYNFVMLANSFEQRPNLPFYDEEVGEPLNDALIRRNRLVEQRYNITIENIADENRDKITSMVKKAVQSDEESYSMIINSTSIGMNTLTTSKCLYDLSEIDLNQSMPWWCKSTYDDFQVDGRFFFTSGALSPFYYYSPVAFAYNKTLTDAYNISGLEEKVLDGSWTYAYMIDLAKDKTHDMNGDSVIDKSDFWAIAEGHQQIYGFDIDMMKRTEDGFAFNPDEDFISKLAIIADFTSSNHNFRDYAISDVYLTMFQNDQLLFLYTSMNNVITGYNAVPSWREMKSDYGLLPLPKYDENQEEYCTQINPAGPNSIAVPINCSDPQRTGLIMETLAYYSYELVKPAIYDLIVKEKGTRLELADTMLDLVYSGSRFYLNSVFNFGGSNDLIGKATDDSSFNFVSSFEALRSKAEKALEKYENALRSFNAD